METAKGRQECCDSGTVGVLPSAKLSKDLDTWSGVCQDLCGMEAFVAFKTAAV